MDNGKYILVQKLKSILEAQQVELEMPTLETVLSICK